MVCWERIAWNIPDDLRLWMPIQVPFARKAPRNSDCVSAHLELCRGLCSSCDGLIICDAHCQVFVSFLKMHSWCVHAHPSMLNKKSTMIEFPRVWIGLGFVPDNCTDEKTVEDRARYLTMVRSNVIESPSPRLSWSRRRWYFVVTWSGAIETVLSSVNVKRKKENMRYVRLQTLFRDFIDRTNVHSIDRGGGYLGSGP
jgi:hypothetical protein